MRLPVVYVLLALAAGQAQTTNIVFHTLAARKSHPKNTIFLKDLLFQTEVASLVSCVGRCFSDKECASLTFTRFSSSSSSPSTSSRKGVCRGHSTEKTAADLSVYSAGSSLWVLKWVGKACTDSAQCLARNSECFAGTCLCTPGYYYSNTSLSCVDNCPLGDLQPTFVAYPGWAISGYNLQVISGVDLFECRASCIAEPRCRTFDFSASSSKCYPQDVSAAEAPSAWVVSSSVVSYQKTCL